MLNILIAGEDPAMVEPLRALLGTRGHMVATTPDGNQALGCLRQRSFDLLIGDNRTAGPEGLTAWHRIRRVRPDMPVLVFGEEAAAASAVRDEEDPALAVLPHPPDLQRLLSFVQQVESAGGGAHSEQQGGVEETAIVGVSSAIAQLRDRMAALGPTPGSVLLTGERGTGKASLARALHERSARRPNPFVTVDCTAALSTLQTETERALAQRGTLFLSEVADLAPEAQAWLLRVLQTRGPGPGARSSLLVPVFSSTTHDLHGLVGEGRFAQELLPTLCAFELRLPPLRERTTDLPLLVERLLLRSRRPTPPVLSVAAWAALIQYPFPGNLRELRNAIEHAVALGRGADELQLEHLPAAISEISVGPVKRSPPSLFSAVEQFEYEYIRRALALAGGEKKRAAQILGISRKSLYKKLGKRTGGSPVAPVSPGRA